MNEYLRKSEIVKEYNLSYTTIQNWIKSGILTNSINGVLFKRADIERAINRPKRKCGRKPKEK